MPAQVPNRPVYNVACACGARIHVDARAFGRPRVCRSCGGSVTVAWGRDPRTRKTVPVAVSRSRRRADPERLPFLAVCGCGYSRPITAQESRAKLECPGCGKRMAVEKAPEPGSAPAAKTPVSHKPAQPLVPLHLRPPNRVKVRPSDKTFECPCGERLLIRPDGDGRPIQCYKCDRFHVVKLDRPAPSKPPAPKTRAPAPRATEKKVEAPPPPPAQGPTAPSRPLRMGEVACACGAIIPPRTSRTGREFTCGQCGRSGRVEERADARTGALALAAVFTGAPAPRGSRPETPPPGSGNCVCVCGQEFDARELMSRGEASCPKCGRGVQFEDRRLTRSRTPGGPPTPTPAPAAPPPVPPPRPSPTPAAPMSILDLVPQPHEDTPAAIPADAQVAVCECGAELLVSRDDLGSPIQCPACDVRMTVEEVPDPSAGITTLRVRSIGRMDGDAWTLDDFK